MSSVKGYHKYFLPNIYIMHNIMYLEKQVVVEGFHYNNFINILDVTLSSDYHVIYYISRPGQARPVTAVWFRDKYTE